MRPYYFIQTTLKVFEVNFPLKSGMSDVVTLLSKLRFKIATGVRGKSAASNQGTKLTLDSPLALSGFLGVVGHYHRTFQDHCAFSAHWPLNR
jgi:hypothetical protein